MLMSDTMEIEECVSLNYIKHMHSILSAAPLVYWSTWHARHGYFVKKKFHPLHGIPTTMITYHTVNATDKNQSEKRNFKKIRWIGHTWKGFSVYYPKNRNTVISQFLRKSQKFTRLLRHEVIDWRTRVILRKNEILGCYRFKITVS